MKVRFAICFVTVLGFAVGTANAFPKIPGYLSEAYKDNAEYKSFFETYNGLKMKCDVCHKPGAVKTEKGHGLNDFGKVYHDRFTHKAFTAADKEGKRDEAMKVFKEAWEKSIKEKNADGKVFLELMKEGKLPGKND